MKFLGATFILWIALRIELKTYSDFAIKTNAKGSLLDQTLSANPITATDSLLGMLLPSPPDWIGKAAGLLIPKAISPNGIVKDLLN